jgi:hypothetical protein
VGVVGGGEADSLMLAAAEAQMKPVPSGIGARVCHSFSRVHIR